MFTGLVEATGRVRSLERLGEQARLSLAIPFAAELELGESVAVNGCCLTVAAIDESGASFDLLGQTLAVTSLGDLAAGATVNLERALRAGDRFGGHFVQGHVDATGTVLALDARGQDHVFDVSLPPEIARSVAWGLGVFERGEHRLVHAAAAVEDVDAPAAGYPAQRQHHVFRR